MSKAPGDFEFDIAISFLTSTDLALAEELAERLSPRFRVFVFTQQQHLLAGRHADEVFPEIFGLKARVVVVLYRDEWGKKGGTLHEMEAIRARISEEGHEYYLFVKMENEARVPAFVPPGYIYLNFLRYGMHALIPNIEDKIQKMGGEVREESLEEMLLRVKKRKDADKRKAQLLSSPHGIKYSNEQSQIFIEAVTTLRETYSTPAYAVEIWGGDSFGSLSSSDFIRRFHCDWFLLQVRYAPPQRGVVNQKQRTRTGLEIELVHVRDIGPLEQGDVVWLNVQRPNLSISKCTYYFDIRSYDDAQGWSSQQEGSIFLTSDQLALHWFRLFAEYAIGERQVKES